jgi:hypothetical protein
MTLSNFKFGKGLGFLNSLVASKAAEVMVAPLEKLKLDAERLVKEYTPPDHVVTELDLTWKGGLWRMALEAALGVQYLHHHRYWSDGGKRHNGATNEVEEEEAGWKVRASARGGASEASVRKGSHKRAKFLRAKFLRKKFLRAKRVRAKRVRTKRVRAKCERTKRCRGSRAALVGHAHN